MNSKFIFSIMIFVMMSSVQANENSGLYSAANQVKYYLNDAEQNFLGNGFLVEVNHKTYAVTAKHVLLEAKKNGITHLSISEQVKQWHLVPFGQESEYVKLGDLINKNKAEIIGMDSLLNDWLVFEVQENKSSLKILSFAETELTPGDKVFAYGCTYANQEDCIQKKYTGIYKGSKGGNLMVKLDVENLFLLRGLSGGPVVNSHDQVVALVSNIIEDEEQGEMYFAPFDISMVKDYLAKKYE